MNLQEAAALARKAGDDAVRMRREAAEQEARHLIDGLTMEQLREWLAKRRASMLTMESATRDHAQAELYRIKAHELLTIINAIDKDELPT